MNRPLSLEEYAELRYRIGAEIERAADALEDAVKHYRHAKRADHLPAGRYWSAAEAGATSADLKAIDDRYDISRNFRRFHTLRDELKELR